MEIKDVDNSFNLKTADGGFYRCCEKIYSVIPTGGISAIVVEVEKHNCGFCGKEIMCEPKAEKVCGKGCRDSLREKTESNAEEEKKNLARERVNSFRESVFKNGSEYAFQCGVGKRHVTCDIENYHGHTDKVKQWLGQHENLLLQSTGSGNGKTHLAVAAMKLYALAERDFIPTIAFFNFSELMAGIRKTFSAGNVSEDDVINFLCSLDLLIIDDIGAEKVSEYVQSTFYIVLNRRNEDVKPTIVTTNLKSQEISSSYGTRVLSRLAAGVTVIVDGVDNRINKKIFRDMPTGTTVRKTLNSMVCEYVEKNQARGATR